MRTHLQVKKTITKLDNYKTPVRTPKYIDISSASTRETRTLTPTQNTRINYQYFLNQEKTLPPQPILLLQKEVTESMRKVIVDWMIMVAINIIASDSSLLFSVQLLDKYLMKESVEKKKLQLVAVACMSISCKLIDVEAPDLRKFSHFTRFAFDMNDISDMEKKILNSFGFRVGLCTYSLFMDYYNAECEGTRYYLYWMCMSSELSALPVSYKIRLALYCSSGLCDKNEEEFLQCDKKKVLNTMKNSNERLYKSIEKKFNSFGLLSSI